MSPHVKKQYNFETKQSWQAKAKIYTWTNTHITSPPSRPPYLLSYNHGISVFIRQSLDLGSIHPSQFVKLRPERWIITQNLQSLATPPHSLQVTAFISRLLFTFSSSWFLLLPIFFDFRVMLHLLVVFIYFLSRISDLFFANVNSD